MCHPRGRVLELPPGYPTSYETSARLADGRQVEIRPVLPSDAAELAEAIRTADSETLHARFLGSPPPLTKATLDTLTRLDYVNRFALVARSRGRGVAIARYAKLPAANEGGTVAEIAVAVRPGWRKVGLASALIELLAARALECGITDFTALFLANNRPVAELARERRASVVIAEGSSQLHATLPTAEEDRFRPDRPDDEAHQ